MRTRPTPAQLFVYGLVVTLLVFLARCRSALILLALVNGVPGFARGARRYPLLVALFILGVAGTFVNSLILANTGRPIVQIGPLTVRQGAVDATINIALRFTALAGVSLVYVTMISPREAVRSLEEELGLPKGIAFSIAFSLRLLGLAQHDLAEIMAMRRQRGAPRIPIRPRDVETVLLPVMSVMLERARWVGIAAELRGFSLRPPRPRRLVPTLGLVVLAALAAVQILAVARCPGLPGA